MLSYVTLCLVCIILLRIILLGSMFSIFKVHIISIYKDSLERILKESEHRDLKIFNKISRR